MTALKAEAEKDGDPDLVTIEEGVPAFGEKLAFVVSPLAATWTICWGMPAFLDS